MDEELIPANQITRKIRIYPNVEQKRLFSKCFGAHRYFYNKAIEQIRENDKIEDSKEKNKANKFISVRNAVVINNSELSEEDGNLWMQDIPYDTRQLAVKVLDSARKAAFSNLRNGNINQFKMHFINKKTSNNIFYVNKKALINGAIFSQKLGKEHKFLKTKNKKDKEAIKQSIGDFSILQEKDGRYYACIVIEPKDKILKQRSNICALDPGVRTFQTMYSPKSIGEFGFDTSKTLYKLYRREDKLKAILATKKLKSNKKYKLKKRCALLRTKIKHIVKDLHWKTCDYLTKKFQVILLPIFNSKQMANKKKRRISRTTTRLLLGLSHYEFQQKLLYKAKQRGRNVILCKEHYTTKCCGNCGTLNEKIGSKKIFHCDNCDLTMDRDIHAARNILVRGLTIYSDNLSGPI
jgi:putative transposase